MQFWRCLVRDLLKELMLAELNIEMGKVRTTEVAFVVKSLVSAMGQVNNVRFTKHGQPILASEAGPGLDEQRSWSSSV